MVKCISEDFFASSHSDHKSGRKVEVPEEQTPLNVAAADYPFTALRSSGVKTFLVWSRSDSGEQVDWAGVGASAAGVGD